MNPALQRLSQQGRRIESSMQIMKSVVSLYDDKGADKPSPVRDTGYLVLPFPSSPPLPLSPLSPGEADPRPDFLGRVKTMV